ncbi:MAG: hypothetical protein ACO2ON_03810 [Candidatus Nanopusillus sp.]
MKLQISERYLFFDIPKFVKESLINHYRDVLIFKESVPATYIRFLVYHAIAYFQYLNSFNTKTAVNLYKEYILSDGKIKTFKYKELEIPLNFDELLDEVSKYLMNYKDIVQGVTTIAYTSHLRYGHRIQPTYITLYNLLDAFNKIGFDGLAALKRHWRIIDKEFIPYLLKNLKNNSINKT